MVLPEKCYQIFLTKDGIQTGMLRLPLSKRLIENIFRILTIRIRIFNYKMTADQKGVDIAVKRTI